MTRRPGHRRAEGEGETGKDSHSGMRIGCRIDGAAAAAIMDPVRFGSVRFGVDGRQTWKRGTALNCSHRARAAQLHSVALSIVAHLNDRYRFSAPVVFMSCDQPCPRSGAWKLQSPESAYYLQRQICPSFRWVWASHKTHNLSPIADLPDGTALELVRKC